MSARTSTELIEAYVARLKAELAFLGTEEADDLVAEIRSLLVEAAGGDTERAAAAIARFGEPVELAVGILTEKGLSPADGMSTAEWWRMGIAAPLDIFIGLAAPVAVAIPAYTIATDSGSGLLGVAFGLALFAAALLWSWYVWRPWRTGGSRRTAGMAVTGLSVVRSPGFRRVVRVQDLETLGLRPAAGGTLFGLVSLAVAILMLGAVGAQVLFSATNPSPAAAFDRAAGTEAEQRSQVAGIIISTYDGLVRFGDDGGTGGVSSIALTAYKAWADRAREETVTSFKVGTPTKVSIGAWTVPATETTKRGTHRVVFTLTLRVEFQPAGGAGSYNFGPSWIINAVSGEGIPTQW